MPIIPAYCRTCDAVIPSGLNFPIGSNARLVGNIAECTTGRNGAHFADVIDGFYTMLNEAIEIASLPSTDMALLRRMFILTGGVKYGVIGQSEAVQDVTRQNPRVGEIFDRWLNRSALIAGILLTVTNMLITHSANQSNQTTVERAVDAFEEIAGAQNQLLEALLQGSKSITVENGQIRVPLPPQSNPQNAEHSDNAGANTDPEDERGKGSRSRGSDDRK